MSSPNHAVKLGLWVLLLILAILISSKIYTGPLREASPFRNLTFPDFNFSSTFIYSFESAGLSKIVRENLSGVEGNFSVYIKDLTSNDKYELKGDDSFPAASLYKLYLVAAVLKEVESGHLSLEDQLSMSKIGLTQAYGEVDFGYEEAPEVISYSVDEALTRVGRISDNFASIMLVEKIGWEKLPDMADSLGAESTNFDAPFATSAKDIGLYFRKLYQKSIVSEDVSNKVMEYLSLNQLNDRLPAKLPKDGQNQPAGWQVVHKTGELPRVRHDGGIVYLNSVTSEVDEGEAKLTSEVFTRAYVIVLLSKDLKYEDEGVEMMANLSREVYEYFSR